MDTTNEAGDRTHRVSSERVYDRETGLFYGLQMRCSCGWSDIDKTIHGAEALGDDHVLREARLIRESQR